MASGKRSTKPQTATGFGKRFGQAREDVAKNKFIEESCEGVFQLTSCKRTQLGDKNWDCIQFNFVCLVDEFEGQKYTHNCGYIPKEDAEYDPLLFLIQDLQKLGVQDYEFDEMVDADDNGYDVLDRILERLAKSKPLVKASISPQKNNPQYMQMKIKKSVEGEGEDFGSQGADMPGGGNSNRVTRSHILDPDVPPFVIDSAYPKETIVYFNHADKEKKGTVEVVEGTEEDPIFVVLPDKAKKTVRISFDDITGYEED